MIILNMGYRSVFLIHWCHIYICLCIPTAPESSAYYKTSSSIPHLSIIFQPSHPYMAPPPKVSQMEAATKSKMTIQVFVFFPKKKWRKKNLNPDFLGAPLGVFWVSQERSLSGGELPMLGCWTGPRRAEADWPQGSFFGCSPWVTGLPKQPKRWVII